jgi:Txe/YoeB family toxin of Txe-Axe toxin-antitoxin module
VTVVKTGLLNHSNIILYPVPATDVLNITASQHAGERLEYEITDLSGRTVQRPAKGTLPLVIKVKNLAQGIYVLRLSDEHSTVYYHFNKH